MRVSLCQLNIAFENKKINTLSVEKFICQSAEMDADIVFFPEMTLTGFSMNVSVIGDKNSETVDLMKRLCDKYKIAVGFGWVKSLSGMGENHYTVVDRNAKVVSDYIKIHPFSYSGENKYYYPGESVSMFEMCGKKISTFVCYDLRFPEIFRAVSMECEIIAAAANWPKQRISHWKKLLEARAVENQCWMLGVNCVGEQQGSVYNGCSRIVSPMGDVVCSLENEEGILVYDLSDEASELRKNFPVNKDRRTELYRELFKKL